MNDIAWPEAELTSSIISSAIEVHRHLGPGLLEKAYEECLMAELTYRGFTAERQVVQPITYKNLQLAKSYKIDLVVENRVLLS